MKIKILGDYNTYITIVDKFNKTLYNGNVFELVELKSNQIKLFFNSIKYNVYNIRITDFSDGIRVRDWLAGQSFEKQYEFGIETLKMFGVK